MGMDKNIANFNWCCPPTTAENYVWFCHISDCLGLKFCGNSLANSITYHRYCYKFHQS